jgi:hypothetical protein
MNLDRNPTKEQLQALLAHCDDTAGHHVLWVANNGDVAIATLPRNWPPAEWQASPLDVRLRYETFLAGNGYVGPEAAEDDGWVGELFDRLTKEWTRVKGTSELELIPID